MKTHRRTLDNVTPILSSIMLALALFTGCADDNPVAVGGDQLDPTIASSLSKSAQTAGIVSDNLDELDLLQNPLSSMAEDADLYQDSEFDGWTGDGMSYPEKSARIANGFRNLGVLERAATAVAARRAKFNVTRPLAVKYAGEPGDTLSVEYFAGPDSTGLNALILVEAPSMVRFVSRRRYPPRLGQAVRIDQEILLDTNGTDQDGSDDVVHSLYHQQEMFGGEIATGTIAPAAGPGPILPEVEVLASYHVANPRFHPLQAWTQTDVHLELGAIETNGDESIVSIETVVHWRSDAEHRASVSVPAGGSITPESIVELQGEFTAAPANRWLESIADTLTARLGDLDDDSDDLLISLNRASIFDGTATDGGHPRTTVTFTPDEPVHPGQEPCGGVAHKEAWYPATWWLVHLVEDADIDCDGSGTFHQLQQYRDGSSSERTITWDGSGAATITENRPDGTVVVGSWDENTGVYSLATTFPDGHDPVSRDQHGQVSENDVAAWDIATFQDGRADTTYVHAVGDDADRTVTGFKVRGDLREDFSLSMQADEHLAGTWSRNDGASGEFDLEAIEGGGSHLTFTAGNPAAEGSPSVEGDVWLAPDGSGTGTISFTQYGETVVMDIEFGPEGSGFLEDAAGGMYPLS